MLAPSRTVGPVARKDRSYSGRTGLARVHSRMHQISAVVGPAGPRRCTNEQTVRRSVVDRNPKAGQKPAPVVWLGFGTLGVARGFARANCPAEGEWLGIRFKLCTFMPLLPARNLSDRKDVTTNVTWAMRGPMPYMSKLMSIFFNMDRMIGKDFEDGLANLKRTTEK